MISVLFICDVTIVRSQIGLSPAGIELVKKTLVSCNVLKIDTLRGSYSSNCSGTLTSGTHTVDINWGDSSPSNTLSISLIGKPSSAIYYFAQLTHSYVVGSNYTITINSGFDNVTCSGQSGNFTLNSLPFTVTQTITCSGVGIENYNLENIDISFFPNPTKSELNISTFIIINTIQIINTTGKIFVTKNNINASNTVLDLNTLPAGIYFIQLQTNEGTVTKKIIKE